MAIDLTVKFAPYVDEQFKAESKRELLTNDDYDWTGAHTIKIYKISTSAMNDYKRNADALTGTSDWSRFGPVKDLDAVTEELTLKNDRSFTFAIDKLDQDETQQQLVGATALARQDREVVIPEVDSYVYGVMVENAGHKPSAVELTDENVYEEILKGSTALDDAEVPDTERVLLVSPTVFAMLKMNPMIGMSSDIVQEMRNRGVLGMLDGAAVVKVPASRVPEGFGFMLAHKSATVAPVKLEDYRVHVDPPGISGSLVEGRICYDAFVLDNKKNAIYYQAMA